MIVLKSAASISMLLSQIELLDTHLLGNWSVSIRLGESA